MTTRQRSKHQQTIEIEGYAIQHDASGIGAAWRPATDADCGVDARNEIACEILDGKVTSCRDYVAKNGLHYRW